MQILTCFDQVFEYDASWIWMQHGGMTEKAKIEVLQIYNEYSNVRQKQEIL